MIFLGLLSIYHIRSPNMQKASGSELNQIYNEPAVRVQIVTRKLASVIGMNPVIAKSLNWIGEHSGAFVYTNQLGTFLIHKGANYAKTPQGNQTVVVRIKENELSSNWRSIGRPFEPQCTIGAIVESMGSDYLFFGANCNDAVANIPFSTVKSCWNRVVPVEDDQMKETVVFSKNTEGNESTFGKLYDILVQPVESIQRYMKNNFAMASLVKTKSGQEIFIRHDIYKEDAQMLLAKGTNDQQQYVNLKKMNMKGIPESMIVSDILDCGFDLCRSFPTLQLE